MALPDMAQHAARNGCPMDLARSIVDAKGTNLTIEELKRKIIADAAGPADLDCSVHYAAYGFGHKNFGHLGLGPSGRTLIEQPGRVPDQKASSL